MVLILTWIQIVLFLNIINCSGIKKDTKDKVLFWSTSADFNKDPKIFISVWEQWERPLLVPSMPRWWFLWSSPPLHSPSPVWLWSLSSWWRSWGQRPRWWWWSWSWSWRLRWSRSRSWRLRWIWRLRWSRSRSHYRTGKESGLIRFLSFWWMKIRTCWHLSVLSHRNIQSWMSELFLDLRLIIISSSQAFWNLQYYFTFIVFCFLYQR